MICETCATFPEASLIPTMFGWAAELDDEVGREVLAGPARHVVEHGRDIEVGDPREMLHQPGAVRLVVVRRDQERAVRAHLPRRPREAERLGRIVRPRAGQDRNLPAGGLDRSLNDLLVLLEREGRGLARRACRDDPVDARREKGRDVRTEPLEIEGLVLIRQKRSYDGREDALKHKRML